MRGGRAFGVAAAAVVGVGVLAATLDFLAPDVAYRIHDRAVEILSGKGGRKLRVVLGSETGSGYRVATVLNRYLAEKSGYELELVSSPGRGGAAALLDPEAHFDFTLMDSGSDLTSDGVVALAALETQYFFVIVPNDSAVRELRDLAGPVNPGTRQEGAPPTLGERVLWYYGMAPPDGATGGTSPWRVSIVRPQLGTNVEDFEAGIMKAATRTQFLSSELIENIMVGGGYRLVPIRDHEALAKSLPGTRPGFIPAGLYGPERRIPAEPVPTITVQQLLVARADVPGRVVEDVLEALYDPRFARDVHYDLSEARGSEVGAFRLHPAAEIFYHRNDLVTSDLLGRLSFVGTLIAALFAGYQFVMHARRNERVRARRKLLGTELTKLEAMRGRVDAAPTAAAAPAAARQADDLLCAAERDAAADLLDAAGIESVRSLHAMCWRAYDQRSADPPVSAVIAPTERIVPAPPAPPPDPGTTAPPHTVAG
jgi:TRAP-type uncharacterized transport system substrate-binding protein